MIEMMVVPQILSTTKNRRRVRHTRKVLPARFSRLAFAARHALPPSSARDDQAPFTLIASSAFLHALALGAAILLSRALDNPSRTIAEPVRMQVVEVQPSPPVEEIAKPQVETPEPEPLVRRSPQPKPVVEPVPAPTPEDSTPSAEVAPEPVRRVIGLSLSSTVKGAAGPAFAVGNTQLGSTAARATQASVVGVLPPSFRSPVRLSMPQPDYPHRLKLQGVEGRVRLSAVIDLAGHPTEIAVVESSGYEDFDHAAVLSAQRGQYQPASRDGMPVLARITFSVEFRLL